MWILEEDNAQHWKKLKAMFGLHYNSNTNYSVNYSGISFCLRSLMQDFTAGGEYLFTAGIFYCRPGFWPRVSIAAQKSRL